MSFESVDQSSGDISIFHYFDLVQLKKETPSINAFKFCCEIRLKDELKAIAPKLPTSDIGLRQSLWSVYKEGVNRNAVTLELKDKEFKICHSVLTSQSEVFKNIFKSNTIEAQSGIVKLRDVSIKAMEVFVEWLYLGDCDKLPKVANELLIFADKYAFVGLKYRCLKYIRDELTLENVFSRLTLSFIYDDKDLKQRCLKFIQKSPRSDHLSSFLSSGEWVKLNNSNPALASKVVSALFVKN